MCRVRRMVYTAPLCHGGAAGIFGFSWSGPLKTWSFSESRHAYRFHRPQLNWRPFSQYGCAEHATPAHTATYIWVMGTKAAQPRKLGLRVNGVGVWGMFGANMSITACPIANVRSPTDRIDQVSLLKLWLYVDIYTLHGVPSKIYE